MDFEQFKQRFAKTPQGMQLLKTAATPQEAIDHFNKAYSDYIQATKPAITQKSKTIPSSGVAKIIATDKTPSFEPKMIDPNEVATNSGQDSIMSRVLNGNDIQQNAKMLQSYGFERPSKGSGILDAIISGVASIGSAASHDYDSSDQIQQGLSSRQAGREAKRTNFSNMLMSLSGQKDPPALIKEFLSFAKMSPENQALMKEYLKAKGSSNPLQEALASLVAR